MPNTIPVATIRTFVPLSTFKGIFKILYEKENVRIRTVSK
jgi:hypothetical protein